jgi:8-oxo-dGTP pyrophosphatase MutT (NUDIX family)
MQKHGPWKIKSSEVKYKSGWLEVREDQTVRTQDGLEKGRIVVVIRPGVAVLPIDDEGNVYLCKEYRYAADIESIHPVNGGIESGEDALVSAKRELMEELGIEAREWIPLGSVQVLSSKIETLQSHFIAKGVIVKEQQLESGEDISLLKYSLDEAVQMVMDGQITEAGGCVLILKAARYFKKL